MAIAAFPIVALVVALLAIAVAVIARQSNAGKIGLVLLASFFVAFLFASLFWVQTSRNGHRPPTIVSHETVRGHSHESTVPPATVDVSGDDELVSDDPRGLTNEDLKTETVDNGEKVDAYIDPPPSWLEPSEIDRGDLKLVVVSSQRWATREEAIQQVGLQVVRVLKQDFMEHEPQAFHPWLLRQAQTKVAMREPIYVESYRQDLGTYEAVMYRAHTQIELSQSIRDHIRPIWREQVVDERLWEVGSLFGAATLVFGFIAMGFKTLPLLSGWQKPAVVVAVLMSSSIGVSVLVYWGRSASVPADVATVETTQQAVAVLPRTAEAGVKPQSVKKLATAHPSNVEPSPNSFFRLDVGQKRVAFIVENSESMMGSGSIKRIKSELKRWCESAKSPVEFLVISYGEEVNSSQLSADCSNAIALLDSLDGTPLKNSDKLNDAIKQALVIKPEHIVILRDESKPNFDSWDKPATGPQLDSVKITCFEMLSTLKEGVRSPGFLPLKSVDYRSVPKVEDE